jgi:uncharacterized protein (TIGR04222 family)
MSLGPFDLTGPAFLLLYLFLLAITVAIGVAVPHRLRPEGRRQRLRDVDQLAFLAGGRRRFADALVSRLLSARALIMTGKDAFAARAGATAGSTAERSLLALPEPISWRVLREAAYARTGPIEEKLIASGLIASPAETANIRFWTLLPYALLLAFGATKWVIGEARERPVGFLTALLLLTALFALVRWLTLDRRTAAGRRALALARDGERRLKMAPTRDEVGLAVALFGTAVLVGSAWSGFHRLRSVGDSGGIGGGGGGGSGCGGGGGGGCGGCGGCGGS